MTTRRNFLQNCATAVAGLALLPAGYATLAGAATRRSPAAPLRYSMFAGQINTIFRTRLASGQNVDLKLLKAPLAPHIPQKPGRRPSADADNEKFSLIFSGPKSLALESAIHRFDHEQLGELELHIGRIGSLDTAALRYEAVFNQPVPQPALTVLT